MEQTNQFSIWKNLDISAVLLNCGLFWSRGIPLCRRHFLVHNLITFWNWISNMTVLQYFLKANLAQELYQLSQNVEKRLWAERVSDVYWLAASIWYICLPDCLKTAGCDIRDPQGPLTSTLLELWPWFTVIILALIPYSQPLTMYCTSLPIFVKPLILVIVAFNKD